MAGELPEALLAWKQSYVEGTVELHELEAALEQYFEDGTVPHDNRVLGHVPTFEGQRVLI